MWSTNSLAALDAATSSLDRVAAAIVARDFVEALDTGAAGAAAEQDRVLAKLRRSRWFPLMADVGRAVIDHGVATFTARRQYGQALIELKRFDEAGAILDAVVAQASGSPEWAEAKGLVGRLYKQLYLDRFEALGPARRDTLEASIAAYLEVYDVDPRTHTWPGINSVALLLRGQRDGLVIRRPRDASQIARDVLRDLSSAKEHWHLATIAEAHIALGEWDAATATMTDYVKHPDADPFSCASTLRQLKEVWQITEDGPGGALITLLQPAVLGGKAAMQKSGVEGLGAPLVLDANDLGAACAHSVARADMLQKTFGKTGPRSASWYALALQRARCVARIETADGTGMGTGFIVRAGALFTNLPSPDEIVLVTNAHVLGKTDDEALDPGAARVRFELVENQRTYGIREILFESPVSELDVTIVRLDGAITGVEPCGFAPREEPTFKSDAPRQFFVIGYPLGGALALSLEDNLQVGWNAPKLHYRTPTKPGSSGSPVFDDSWRVVALHHAGSDKMQRLDGQPGIYEANEGIWIHAIANAIAALEGTSKIRLESSPPAVTPAFRTSIFISYAHADGAMLKNLKLAMAPLERKVAIDCWDDSKIVPSTNWRNEIDGALERARVAILLVSMPFLASRFIHSVEFPKLLEGNAKRGLTILPIAIAASSYKSVTQLSTLQFANDPEKPLAKLKKADREAALVRIVERLEAVVDASSLSNSLRAIDAASYQATGFGGTASAELGVAGFGASVAQNRDGSVVLAGADSRSKLVDLDDLSALDPESRKLITVFDATIRNAFDQWTTESSKRPPLGDPRRAAADQQLAALRGEMCETFKQLLDFFQRQQWYLNDHYQAVRYLCSCS